MKNFQKINVPHFCLTLIYIYIDLDANSIGVIVIENELDETRSNPGQGCSCFTLCDCPWERPESVSSPFSYGWIVGKTGFFSFDQATSQEEGRNLNSNAKASKFMT